MRICTSLYTGQCVRISEMDKEPPWLHNSQLKRARTYAQSNFMTTHNHLWVWWCPLNTKNFLNPNYKHKSFAFVISEVLTISINTLYSVIIYWILISFPSVNNVKNTFFHISVCMNVLILTVIFSKESKYSWKEPCKELNCNPPHFLLRSPL